MKVEKLTYEQTIAALQAFVGTSVSVSLMDADSKFLGAVINGPLQAAKGLDYSILDPEVYGDRAGETMHFVVGDPQVDPVFGGFAVWENGFEGASRTDWGDGDHISVQIAGLQITVFRSSCDSPKAETGRV